MKKSTRIAVPALALCLAIFVQCAFAAKPRSSRTPESERTATLYQHFPNAKNLTWHASGNSFVAYYTIRDEKAISSFTEKGALLFTLIYRKTSELPVNIYEKLNNQYKGFEITNVEEYLSDNAHYYSILLESKTQVISLNADNANNIEVLQKLKRV